MLPKGFFGSINPAGLSHQMGSGEGMEIPRKSAWKNRDNPCLEQARRSTRIPWKRQLRVRSSRQSKDKPCAFSSGVDKSHKNFGIGIGRGLKDHPLKALSAQGWRENAPGKIHRWIRRGQGLSGGKTLQEKSRDGSGEADG